MTAIDLRERRAAPVARRTYRPEDRLHAVAQVFRAIDAAGGERFGVVTQVARDLGIAPGTLRNWVKRAEEREDHRTTGVRSDVVIDLRGDEPVIHLREDEPIIDLRRRPLTEPDDGARLVALPVAASGTERLRALALALRWPLLAYAMSRLVVLVSVAIAVSQPYRGLTTGRVLVPWPPAPASSPILGAFGVWDASWYLHVAAFGYSHLSPLGSHLGWDMAFFPMFPLLIRAGTVFGWSYLAAGVAVGLLLGALATAAVWMVARKLLGERTATTATALWALFPGAFVLSFAYSEGLTVLAAAVCLWALLDRRWPLAGLAAAVAGATQPAGLVLVLCCTYAAWREMAYAPPRATRSTTSVLAPLWAPTLAPVGVLAYFAFLWKRSGDPLAWYHSERLFWDHGGALFGIYKTTLAPVIYVVGHPWQLDNAVMLVIGLAIAAGGVALLWKWRPPAILWIWVVGTLGLTLVSAPVGLRPRFLMVAFPIFLAAGWHLPRRWLWPALAAEAVVLALLTFFTVTTLTLVP